MAKITDPDDLIVSSTSGNLGVNGNIWLDTTAKTFALAPYGNLVAKDGVTGNAIWAKFVDLWNTTTYQPFPFPMNVYDARSGQYVFGQDPGGTYNGWKPLDNTTRQMIRDAGFSEYSNAGVLNRQYVGVVVGSNAPAGTQFYFQRASTGPAINFTFTDAPNEAIQVYGDASNGSFDERTYFKVFLRRYNYSYDSKVLADIFESGTGAYKIAFGTATSAETKITADDTAVGANAPYTSITVEYFGSDQTGYDIGAYPFRVEIDNTTANATLEQIYTKIQYLLRQDSDIDTGSGTVNGKTANSLCYFVGDTLYTTQGVFINGVIPADLNRVVFLDQNSVPREYPYAAAGILYFNSPLTSGSTGNYRMYITDSVTGSDDYGTATAITLNDKDGSPITGSISGASISFTFAYDTNNQGGRAVFTSPGGDVPVTVVAGNPGSAKPVVATGTITKSKSISITLTAETDRAYIA